MCSRLGLRLGHRLAWNTRARPGEWSQVGPGASSAASVKSAMAESVFPCRKRTSMTTKERLDVVRPS